MRMTSNAWNAAVLAALLAPVAAEAGKPAPPPAPTFGLSVAQTKVGDSFGDTLYGGGGHNMARVGTQLYVAYTVRDGPDGSYPVTVRLGRSPDGGLTWLSSLVVVHTTGIAEYGAALAIGPDPAGAGRYRIHVVYEWSSYPVADSLFYTSATLDASTGNIGAFSSPVVISGAAYGGFSGEIAVAADGVGGVHAAYVATADGYGGTASGIVYSHSADYGASFAESGLLVAPNGRFPSFAADAAGDVFLAYDSGAGSYVAKRAAGASAFASPVLATSTGGEDITIACLDGDHVYLGWVWDSQAPQTTYHLARSTNGGATWSTTNGPSIGNCLFAPSVAVSAGAVGIAWTDYCSFRGGFARSTDGGSSWSTPAVIPSMPWAANLLLDDAAKANIAFVGMTDAVYFTKEK